MNSQTIIYGKILAVNEGLLLYDALPQRFVWCEADNDICEIAKARGKLGLEVGLVVDAFFDIETEGYRQHVAKSFTPYRPVLPAITDVFDHLRDKFGDAFENYEERLYGE